MRIFRHPGILCLILGVCGVMSAQTVDNIGLNPYGIKVDFSYNTGSGQTSYTGVGGGSLNYPYPDTSPDDWSYHVQTNTAAGTQILFDLSSSTDGSTTGGVASFSFSLRNLSGSTLLVGRDNFAFLGQIVGLVPADSNLQLSGVNITSSSVSPAQLDLRAYPNLGSASAFQSESGYGTLFALNSYATNGILTIMALASNTPISLVSGGNFLISGTFSAVSIAAIPEPATFALVLTLGAMGYVGWKRRGSPATKLAR